MKQLENEYTAHNRVYKLVKRTDKVAMYKSDDGVVISDDDLSKAKAVITKRLEAKNIFDGSERLWHDKGAEKG